MKSKGNNKYLLQAMLNLLLYAGANKDGLKEVNKLLFTPKKEEKKKEKKRIKKKIRRVEEFKPKTVDVTSSYDSLRDTVFSSPGMLLMRGFPKNLG